jgi:hypothetical protein
VSLGYIQVDHVPRVEHYAFHVSEPEFDQIDVHR